MPGEWRGSREWMVWEVLGGDPCRWFTTMLGGRAVRLEALRSGERRRGEGGERGRESNRQLKLPMWH